MQAWNFPVPAESIWEEVEGNDNHRTHRPLRRTSRSSCLEGKCVRDAQRKEHSMFETATFSYDPSSKRVWTTARGFTGQAALIGCLMFAPLVSRSEERR